MTGDITSIMPVIKLGLLAFDEFCRLIADLAAGGEADLFLSSPGFPGEDRCCIGLEPIAELYLTENTARTQIADFAFASPFPTLGHLSYTFNFGPHKIQPRRTTAFPLGHLKKYKYFLEYNLASSELTITGPAGTCDCIDITPMMTPDRTAPLVETIPSPLGQYRQSLSRSEYIDGVKAILEAIRDGYIYQLNLSIKYSTRMPGSDLSAVFLHLWQQFPAPFYVYFHSYPHTMLSTSPERFLRVTDGRVLSQPIKGTLHFSRFEPRLSERLQMSPKEAAELSMIVDMVRNDISMNCSYGSVSVENHKSTFVVDNLIQMYSDVRGQLRHDRTCLDLLLDAFPGASVTGCPKKKAMEMIDRLEPHARDVYCGSFVIIRDERNLDSSIAIRTGYHDRKDENFHFFAGSGIVIDSVPEDEYAETTAKAHKFIRLCRGEERYRETEPQ
jgi:para-aminobenzoate synthetase component 1